MAEKNLLKLRTLTRKRISPFYAEGHSEEVTQQLLAIEIPAEDGYVHITELLPCAHQMVFYDNSPIIQGQLSDREFLNALALIGGHEQLRNCFVEGDERYVFKFYKKGAPYQVVVDLTVPALEHIPKYGRTAGNSIWVSLFEKAYATLCGGYDQLAGVSLRDALRDLCGLDPEIIVFASDNVIKESFTPLLTQLKASDSLIGLMNLGSVEPNKGIKFVPKQNQLYSLEGFEGPLLSLSYSFEGTQAKITVSDAILGFNCLVIVKDFPLDYRGMQIQVATTEHGVPSAGNQQWINNPNFQFQIGLGVNQLEIPFVIRLSELEPHDGVTGFILMNQRDVRTFNQKNVVYMTRPNSVQIGARKQNYSCFYGVLPKGYYTLWVFSTSKESRQALLEIFYAGRPSTLEFKFKSFAILEYAVGSEDLRKIVDSKTDIAPGCIKYKILKNPLALPKERQYSDLPQADYEMDCIIQYERQSFQESATRGTACCQSARYQ